MVGPRGQEVQPFEAHGSQVAVALLSTQPWLSHSRHVFASLQRSQLAGHLRRWGGGGQRALEEPRKPRHARARAHAWPPSPFAAAASEAAPRLCPRLRCRRASLLAHAGLQEVAAHAGLVDAVRLAAHVAVAVAEEAAHQGDGRRGPGLGQGGGSA